MRLITHSYATAAAGNGTAAALHSCRVMSGRPSQWRVIDGAQKIRGIVKSVKDEAATTGKNDIRDRVYEAKLKEGQNGLESPLTYSSC